MIYAKIRPQGLFGSGEEDVTVIDIDHFYRLAVEAGFYGDTGRVIGFFTKLSNGDHG